MLAHFQAKKQLQATAIAPSANKTKQKPTREESWPRWNTGDHHPMYMGAREACGFQVAPSSATSRKWGAPPDRPCTHGAARSSHRRQTYAGPHHDGAKCGQWSCHLCDKNSNTDGGHTQSDKEKPVLKLPRHKQSHTHYHSHHNRTFVGGPVDAGCTADVPGVGAGASVQQG